jgi:hypothetical protein
MEGVLGVSHNSCLGFTNTIYEVEYTRSESKRIWIMMTRDLRSMLEFFYAGMPFEADIAGLESRKNGRL